MRPLNFPQKKTTRPTRHNISKRAREEGVDKEEENKPELKSIKE